MQIIKPSNDDDRYEFDYDQNEDVRDISSDEGPYYDDVRSQKSYIRPTFGSDAASGSAYQNNNNDNKRHIGRPVDVLRQHGNPHYYRDSELFIPDNRNNVQANRKPPPSYRLQVQKISNIVMYIKNLIIFERYPFHF